jgi:hypothetical protein
VNSSISSSKNFVIYLLFVSGVVVIALLGGIECFLRQQELINAESDSYKSRFMNGKATWVALGDSHPASALTSTAWLDNLGQASDNLSSIEGKVDILLARRTNLEGVILQADPQVFAYYRLMANQAERIKNLDHTDDGIHLLILRPDNRPYLSRLAWSLMSDQLRFNSSTNNTPIHDEKVTKNAHAWRRNVALRVQLHTPIPNLSDHHAAVKYRALVERIQSKNIKVCLVAYPVSELYREMTNEAASFLTARRFFRVLAEETRVKLVDQSAAFPENSFNDPDHLLASEAPAFTKVLQHACEVDSRELP